MRLLPPVFLTGQKCPHSTLASASDLKVSGLFCESNSSASIMKIIDPGTVTSPTAQRLIWVSVISIKTENSFCLMPSALSLRLKSGPVIFGLRCELAECTEPYASKKASKPRKKRRGRHLLPNCPSKRLIPLRVPFLHLFRVKLTLFDDLHPRTEPQQGAEPEFPLIKSPFDYGFEYINKNK